MDLKEAATRRKVLLAGLGGAAALAADRLLQPTAVSAAVNPVQTDSDNPSEALTEITQGTADADAFRATANGAGTGLEGLSTSGTGVAGASTSGPGVVGSTTTTDWPAVAGLQGDLTGAAWGDGGDGNLDIGVYGFSNVDLSSSGVFGETGSGTGVVGVGFDAGSIGVIGLGSLGAWLEGVDGVFAVAQGNGNGLQAHTGNSSTAPLPPANTALFASVAANTQVGIEARGRVRFPNRSGRSTIGSGKSSVSVGVSGMTSSNFAIATLNSSRSGRWVRAVVCASGKITIYLNTTVSKSTSVAWLVLG